MINTTISLSKSRKIYSALPNPHFVAVTIAAISQTTSAVSVRGYGWEPAEDFEVDFEQRGTDNRDILHGTEQGDYLFGRNGKDTLFGNRGDDVLYGRE